jgi:hypothetical protein
MWKLTPFHLSQSGVGWTNTYARTDGKKNPELNGYYKQERTLVVIKVILPMHNYSSQKKELILM